MFEAFNSLEGAAKDMNLFINTFAASYLNTQGR